VVAALAVLTAFAVPAAAETFRFVESDGTVHLTNTPTDPQYVRMGFSGTDQGWLKLPVSSLALPVPDLAPYAREIREAAERHGVEEGLIKAVIKVESAFNPRAVSPKGARGLMQLMPGTASMLGVRNSFDPKQNIEGGVRHLRGLIDRFGKDLKLALAAYNAGEQAVVTHGGVPPYRETRDYVTRILGMFAPAPAMAAPAPEPEPALPTYRIEGPDGTVTYTNIRPSRKL
jgi:soluble lytic murein transglycosylase-like protein